MSIRLKFLDQIHLHHSMKCPPPPPNPQERDHPSSFSIHFFICEPLVSAKSNGLLKKLTSRKQTNKRTNKQTKASIPSREKNLNNTFMRSHFNGIKWGLLLPTSVRLHNTKRSLCLLFRLICTKQIVLSKLIVFTIN